MGPEYLYFQLQGIHSTCQGNLGDYGLKKGWHGPSYGFSVALLPASLLSLASEIWKTWSDYVPLLLKTLQWLPWVFQPGIKILSETYSVMSNSL